MHSSIAALLLINSRVVDERKLTVQLNLHLCLIFHFTMKPHHCVQLDVTLLEVREQRTCSILGQSCALENEWCKKLVGNSLFAWSTQGVYCVFVTFQQLIS